jgi:hypothetical protein
MRIHRPALVGTFASALLACPTLSEPPCQVARIDSGAIYLVQLRPKGDFPPECPRGQQYQVLLPSMYTTYGESDPPLVTFQLAASNVSPLADAQATGKFTTFLTPPGNRVCTVPELTPATDDSVTPVNAPSPVGLTTYTFSNMNVLSDAAHRGNQFEALAAVDYGIPGCAGLQYAAQALVVPTACIDDTICLPDAVANDVPSPWGRGYGSQLSNDYRAFCNLDPALLDNPKVGEWLGTGRGIPDLQGNPRDVGVCFVAEPFPSLCPAGSTLSTTGPCVVGPGSNPH